MTGVKQLASSQTKWWLVCGKRKAALGGPTKTACRIGVSGPGSAPCRAGADQAGLSRQASEPASSSPPTPSTICTSTRRGGKEGGGAKEGSRRASWARHFLHAWPHPWERSVAHHLALSNCTSKIRRAGKTGHAVWGRAGEPAWRWTAPRLRCDLHICRLLTILASRAVPFCHPSQTSCSDELPETA